MDDVVFSYADADTPLVKRKLIRIVEAATGQRKLKKIYMDHRRSPVAESFFNSAVRRLALNVLFDPHALAAIPREGPLVLVANHPYGVLDGIVISWLIEQVRSDFYVLTHSLLLRAPEVRPYLLAVDFAGTEEALQTNLASRAAARDHLAKGGCIVVFPAGGVSTAPDRWGRHPAVDTEWQPFTAQLIQRAKATVVPICFGGQNSRLFQIASHLSQTLRLSLIFHEVKNRIGTDLPVAIGAPIPYAELAAIKGRPELAAHLMQLTYGLQAQLPPSEKGKRRPKLLAKLRRPERDRSVPEHRRPLLALARVRPKRPPRI